MANVKPISQFTYITLRQQPEWKEQAAQWFHHKWGVPQEAYLECMDTYLSGQTEYGWYLCLDKDKIVGGLGVIENDFHDRKDLTPNICAVYTEAYYRCKGIAGRLLDMAVVHYKKPCGMQGGRLLIWAITITAESRRSQRACRLRFTDNKPFRLLEQFLLRNSF